MGNASSGFQQIADDAWVHTSERETATSTIVAITEHDCVLIDPAIEPRDLRAIADFVKAKLLRIRFGWSTHPHWDHVLWASVLGSDVPRYATAANVEACESLKDALREEIERTCPGHETDLCGQLTVLPQASSVWPASCEVVEHSAHAPGHGALFFTDRGVFVAGDMISDIEIPSFDLDRPDPLADYERALDLYSRYIERTVVFVPGHGAPGDRTEMQRRIDLDRSYLRDLATGTLSTDDRRGPQWLQEQHEQQVAWCSRRRP